MEAYFIWCSAPRELLEAKASDGTTLYATILLPEGKIDAASVPLIVNPYGGPAVMTIQNKWGGDGFLFDTLLTQHGFAVLHADNRGMAGRGREFAHASYHNFGPVQLEDQLTVHVDVMRWPKYTATLDPEAAGVGQGDGVGCGTFTLYALTHSDRFRTGVAVAPVTDWHNYDSIYTERPLYERARRNFPRVTRTFPW